MGGSEGEAFLATCFLYLLVYPLYYALAEGFVGGRTLGKALVGIAVTRGDGSPAGPRRTFIRELARLVMLPLWITPIVDHLLALRRDRRTLHDRIAGTVVIERDVSLRDRRIAVGAIGCLVALAAVAILWDSVA